MNNNFNCLRDPVNNNELILDGDFIKSPDGKSHPIINNIPRFVDVENYSTDFGVQWNMFPKTQLDSHTKLDVSESRLARCLQDDLENIRGKLVLEAGSGAGRFTEILLKYGAIVHSFDFSNAVEANAKNNGHNENLTLVQADIRKIPFKKSSYDYVVCLGVLQHTPDPDESILALWEMLKPNGALVIDHYAFKWRVYLPPPLGQALDIYRMIILKLPRKSRFKVVKYFVDFWFPIHWKYKESLLIQRVLRRLSPVIFHYHSLKLPNRQMYYEWALLDTHDSTTDFYRHHRTAKQIHQVLDNLNAIDIVVKHGGNGIEAYCKKS